MCIISVVMCAMSVYCTAHSASDCKDQPMLLNILDYYIQQFYMTAFVVTSS